jgi:hypothetical protein
MVLGVARPPEASQRASDKLYTDTAARLCEGLEKALANYVSRGLREKRIHEIWIESGK